MPSRSCIFGWWRAGRKLTAFLLGLFALSFCAPCANANGRFPRAQRLIEDPEDPNRLALSATYGVILTSDRGQTWAHVCESAYAFGIYESDRPLLEFLDDGRLLAGTFASLNATTDQGCNFRALLGGADNQSVPDMSVEADGTIVALLAESLAEGGSATTLRESRDRGETWASLGDELALGAATTLDSAPSDRNRLYVTGLGSTGSGVILRSSDRGQSFESFDIPGTGFNDTPYIAAVDPGDPDRVFVRTNSVTEQDGLPWANDALLWSQDGGETWEELMRLPVKLYGFALEPGGQSVLLGYGNPNDLTGIDERATGIYRLSLAAVDVERIFDASVNCLRFTPRGLYVCTAQSEVGYELGFAPNADFTLDDPEPLTPLLRAPEIRPLSCGSGNGTDVCLAEWDSTCPALAACGTDPIGPGGADGGMAGRGGASGSSSERGGSCSVARGRSGAAIWLLIPLGFLWRCSRRPLASVAHALSHSVERRTER